MSIRPTVIDLFAGAGGMSLGFEQAGFDVVAAVEIDPIHAAVHHFNFPNCNVLARSVVELDAGEIWNSKGTNNSKRKVDVVCGGAPCQGFSLIGQRAFDDPRNLLIKEFVRLVTDLEPKYFVFENVKGLTVGEHKKFLDVLIKEFKRHGYSIRDPWRVLNANNYGVPQHRERLFLLGAKVGCELPKYPETHNSLITCQDALEDLPNIDDYDELISNDSVRLSRWTPRSEYASELHCEKDAGWHFGYRRHWNRTLLTSSMRTAHTSISKRRFRETPHGQVEPISRLFRLSPDGQSNTLRAGTDSARGAFTSPRPIHYKFDRCISVREMARLHGYPDWFRFHVTKWHGARQIGNSVPPPLARCVATSIIQALGIKPQPPSSILQMDNPDLLSMDMSAASAYWDVEAPIQKRDRKTGIRKRKQTEIEELRLAAY